MTYCLFLKKIQSAKKRIFHSTDMDVSLNVIRVSVVRDHAAMEVKLTASDSVFLYSSTYIEITKQIHYNKRKCQ